MDLKHRPVAIIVRDGWGANPFPEWNHANAVHLADTPIADRLMARYPHALIKTSGRDVGLPDGTMGNSEVGHQNIGAGRIVEQEIIRITARIEDGTFFENAALLGAFNHAKQTGGRVHIMGLCSNGRVHSDLDHLDALIQMPARVGLPGDRVFIHAFTDGRDTPPDAGLGFIQHIEQECRAHGLPPVASVAGRFFAMDRDYRWERIEKAYRMLVSEPNVDPTRAGIPTFGSAEHAIQHYYDHPSAPNMKGDEFITPSIVCADAPDTGRIRDGDSVIFFNFRGDRPRELVQAFTSPEFPYEGVDKTGQTMHMGFDRGGKLDLDFVTMTAYQEGLPVKVAYKKPPPMVDILGQYLADRNLRQFRSAETEKFAHVTFFFNDYRNEPFPGEDRGLVHSPRDVTTYDQKPKMSALEVTDLVLKRIATGVDDVLVINFANGDMVGHTGNLKAAISAIATVDACVGRVVDAVLKTGGALIVTADHGNSEQMIDPKTGGPHTAHTTYPVEMIVVAEDLAGRSLKPGGRLADIAPTALDLMGLPIPATMTGRSLL